MHESLLKSESCELVNRVVCHPYQYLILIVSREPSLSGESARGLERVDDGRMEIIRKNVASLSGYARQLEMPNGLNIVT